MIWFGILSGTACVFGLWKAYLLLCIEVSENSSVILTNFGKWEAQFDQPGHYFIPSKILPWVKCLPVSRRVRDHVLKEISVHDCNGTSLLLDIWVEFSITDPRKSLFAVENWKESMQSLLTHSISSLLSGLSFDEILKNRTIFEHSLLKDLERDFDRWGIRLHRLMVHQITLFPDVNRQILQGIASHLDKKKALIEEEGLMKSKRIVAATEEEVSSLGAEAAGQMSLAVGRAYQDLKKDQEVFEAFDTLHSLSLHRKEKLIVFEGFEDNFRSTDASLFLAEGLQKN
jgi:regulator of protease activity HflC (stomatin/prohibitin superfamily)